MLDLKQTDCREVSVCCGLFLVNFFKPYLRYTFNLDLLYITHNSAILSGSFMIKTVLIQNQNCLTIYKMHKVV